jgi:cleavage stimulation factor subunit 3
MAYVELDARALFEKSVGSLDAEKARPIWQRWLQYQMGVADLATIIKLDKRAAEAYPKGEVFPYVRSVYELTTSP